MKGASNGMRLMGLPAAAPHHHPTTSMDPLPSPEPHITVEQPDDIDDMDNASSDMDVDFQTHFLHAQTKSFRHVRLRVDDQPMDWEDYVVEEAASHPPTLRSLSSSTGEIGNHISHICADLIDVFGDEKKYVKFLNYSGDAAQDLLDLIQKVDMTGYPISSGGFGEVYMADYQGKAICVKVTFSREAVVWGQLSHPNILPFYGIHRLNDPLNRMCLVSPWMFNGNIHDYLKKKPDADRTPLISDIAAGMKYLHENGVVHGDLKCLNILVTDSEQACLADFGLSYVTDASGLKGYALSSQHADGGTPGFDAPELVDPDKDDASRKTEASDVYAFGMVCYEILAGERPFGKVKAIAVIQKIMKGQHPQRPIRKGPLERGLTEEMWKMMKRCWAQNPDERPTAAEIVQLLPSINRPSNGWTHTQRPGFDTSSGQVDTTITTARMHLQSLLVNDSNSDGDVEVAL
ncbi:hypothetical protein DXG01_006695 [Tephrocybe rancida]|nr:hypothetical protein DXG01_006695 [Tephrocybe rancida]